LADNQDAIDLKRRARRRLVGAIALVVFVVIALPIVLDSEPKPTVQDLTIQIPSQDAGKFSTRVLPAPSDPAPVSTAPPQSPPVPVPDGVPAPAPDTAVAKAAPPSPPTPTAPKAAAPAAKAGTPVLTQASPATTIATEVKSPIATDRGFVVPLGLFSKADNIKQVRTKATAAGFNTYTEAVAGSASVRVRAGPFNSRDAADKAREKLKSAGLDVGAVTAR